MYSAFILRNIPFVTLFRGYTRSLLRNIYENAEIRNRKIVYLRKNSKFVSYVVMKVLKILRTIFENIRTREMRTRTCENF